MPAGARPEISPRKVGPAVTVTTRRAQVGYGTDNNNQDSAKRPSPGNPAPDSHVNTPEGKPSV